MVLRNLTKALGVLLLLFLVSSLLAVAQPRSSWQAQAETPPEPAPAGMDKKQGFPDELSLELRLKIDPRVLKTFYASEESPDGLAGLTSQARYMVHLVPKANLSTVASVADVRDRRQAVVDALRRTATRTTRQMQHR